MRSEEELLRRLIVLSEQKLEHYDLALRVLSDAEAWEQVQRFHQEFLSQVAGSPESMREALVESFCLLLREELESAGIRGRDSREVVRVLKETWLELLATGQLPPLDEAAALGAQRWRAHLTDLKQELNRGSSMKGDPRGLGRIAAAGGLFGLDIVGAVVTSSASQIAYSSIGAGCMLLFNGWDKLLEG